MTERETDMAKATRCVRAGIWTATIGDDFGAAHEALAFHHKPAWARIHLKSAVFHAGTAIKELPAYRAELDRIKAGAERLGRRLEKGRPTKKILREVTGSVRNLSRRAQRLVYRAEKDCGFKRPSMPKPL